MDAAFVRWDTRIAVIAARRRGRSVDGGRPESYTSGRGVARRVRTSCRRQARASVYKRIAIGRH